MSCQREETGWFRLTRYQSLQKIIDTLLKYPPDKTFNISELAEDSGVSRHSVSNHFDLLEDLNIIEEEKITHPREFSFNQRSETSQMIMKLAGRINEVCEDE